MSDISQKILEKIKEKKIEPKSKWGFLLKDYLIWLFFGLSVLVGSLAVSVIIFLVVHLNSPMKPARMFLPYFWIIILTLFLFLAYYNFKYTKKGYKYNPYLIIVISILISIVLGAMLYRLSFGRKMEGVFYRRFPVYQKIMNRQGRMMVAPGQLGGVLNKDFTLKSFTGEEWKIISKEMNQELFDERVMIFGRPVSEKEFEAERIIPFFERKR